MSLCMHEKQALAQHLRMSKNMLLFAGPMRRLRLHTQQLGQQSAAILCSSCCLQPPSSDKVVRLYM